MNELNYYLLFNPELKNLNINTIKKLYNNDLKLNEENDKNLKVISLESFFKKYPNYNKKNLNIQELVYWHNENLLKNISYEQPLFSKNYLNEEEIAVFKSSGLGIFSLTVYAEKPMETFCAPGSGCC